MNNKLLKELRLALNLTQVDVQNNIYIQHNLLSMIERGKTLSSIYTLETLANYYNIPIELLFDEEAQVIKSENMSILIKSKWIMYTGSFRDISIKVMPNYVDGFEFLKDYLLIKDLYRNGDYEECLSACKLLNPVLQEYLVDELNFIIHHCSMKILKL